MTREAGGREPRREWDLGSLRRGTVSGIEKDDEGERREQFPDL